jgi:aryl-alcohol dehydrogenase-like predicted oxidoreductase
LLGCLGSGVGASDSWPHRREVSPLCLGAMMFGEWGNPDHEASIRFVHRALEAGVNFVDTADVYEG